MTHPSRSRRYFFGTGTDDEELSFDTKGLLLIDDEDARRNALAALPDMAWVIIPDGDHRTFSVCVKDEDGRVVYKASLVLHGEWVQRR